MVAIFFKSTVIKSPPTHTGAGHRWTVSTNTSCNQRLSPAEPSLEVARAGRNRFTGFPHQYVWVGFKLVKREEFPWKMQHNSFIIFINKQRLCKTLNETVQPCGLFGANGMI